MSSKRSVNNTFKVFGATRQEKRTKINRLRSGRSIDNFHAGGSLQVICTEH